VSVVGKPEKATGWYVIEINGQPYMRPRSPGLGYTLGERPELLTGDEAAIEIRRLKEGGHAPETISARRWSPKAPVLPPIKIADIPEVDLRHCTRGSDRTQSRIDLVDDNGYRKTWLRSAKLSFAGAIAPTIIASPRG